jgi:hypothetical protein
MLAVKAHLWKHDPLEGVMGSHLDQWHVFPLLFHSNFLRHTAMSLTAASKIVVGIVSCSMRLIPLPFIGGIINLIYTSQRVGYLD